MDLASEFSCVVSVQGLRMRVRGWKGTVQRQAQEEDSQNFAGNSQYR